MKQLTDAVTLGQVTVKNRICLPPMVIYNLSLPGGIASEENVVHYRAMAEGGFGLIIQEATCVSPEGLLHPSQLGIWSDDQIPGLRRITDAVHGAGSRILVQLHHAGLVACTERHFCPSPYEKGAVTGEEMTLADIAKLREDFVSAALRAESAGYDGVELHGCHGYLLSQFFNCRVNRRRDPYGDGLSLVLEIFRAIRQVCRPDFLVGIRLGGFEPALSDSIRHARALDAAGIDFLDISYGFSGEMDTAAPGNPDLKDIIRAAGAIKAQVSCPVFAVNGICTPAEAEQVLGETDVDMADIGRSALVDPNWPKKALAGAVPGTCLHCKTCQWRIDRKRCPGRMIMERNT